MTHVPPGVPRENVQLDLDRPHMEILHVEETKAFQVMAGVTHAEYEALETEPPYVKIGVGFAAMDEGYFSRSPGADADGPVETRELFGHSWIYCARPVGSPELPPGAAGRGS